jgi:hypothetical protein
MDSNIASAREKIEPALFLKPACNPVAVMDSPA